MEIAIIIIAYFVVGYGLSRILIKPMEADARARVMAIPNPTERAVKEAALTNAQTFGRPIAMFVIMLLWPVALIGQGLKKLRK